MINVLVHNLATGVFMNDGVVLNNPVIPTDTAAARLRKALGLTFEDAVISISIIGDFLGFMSAFPWIEEIINPEDWDNKTYIPSRLTLNTYARDIGTNTPAKYYLDKLNKKDIQEMLTDVGYFSDYAAADSDEEKLCWIILGIALSMKFYTKN